MSQKTAKKLGFWMSLAMLAGSVVGIGIFFKNGSIASGVGNNGANWLLAWILGGVISLAAAINFSEISFLKNRKITGLANWSHQVGGKKFGYFVNISFTFFYSPILITVLGVFVSEIMFWFIQSIISATGSKIILELKIWHHLIVGLAFSFTLIITNLISMKAGGRIQLITTFIKFIPLVIAIFAGIIAFNTHNAGGTNAFVPNTEKIAPFDFSKVLLVLPAVLFSYDAFLGVGALSRSMKNPQKTLPKVVLVGMISVVTLYTLIAISSILHNQGSIEGLLKDSLPKSVSIWLTPVVLGFLFISAFGVTNGLTAAYVAQIENNIDAQTVFGAKFLTEKWGKNIALFFKKVFKKDNLDISTNKKIASFIVMLFMFIFWAIIIWVPALAFNSDKFIDGASNFPTAFFFTIYGVVILLYSIKRKSLLKDKKINSILFYTCSVVAIIGILTFDIGLIYALIDAAVKNTENQSWGFLLGNGYKLTSVTTIIMYAVYLFALLPFFPTINYICKKYIEKVNVIDKYEALVNLENDDEELANKPIQNNHHQNTENPS